MKHWCENDLKIVETGHIVKLLQNLCNNHKSTSANILICSNKLHLNSRFQYAPNDMPDEKVKQ